MTDKTTPVFKIGKTSFDLKATKGDTAFVKATGCGRGELGRILDAHPDAHLVASSLLPLLAVPVPLHELTALVASAGALEVGRDVAAVLRGEALAEPDTAS